ncbi:hypothetical protein PN483_19220, partial [Nodularia spumigena CS-591/04]|uniref:hypothetical protein n=1 Tax=Nodularia spumigena TaxID=70799 RepID=UPI0023310147
CWRGGLIVDMPTGDGVLILRCSFLYSWGVGSGEWGVGSGGREWGVGKFLFCNLIKSGEAHELG